jgi:hypothetical protein
MSNTSIKASSVIENITKGEAVASKALVVDSNKDISNIRNFKIQSTEDGSTNPVPLLHIENTNTAVGSSGELRFDKNVTSAANEHIGEINFYAKDSGNNTSEHFCGILGQVAIHTAGSESGKLSLQLKTDGNATMVTGLLLEGHSTTNGRVDVTVGAHANSFVTIPGFLVLKNHPVIPPHTSGLTKEEHTGSGTLVASKVNTVTYDGSAQFAMVLPAATINSRLSIFFRKHTGENSATFIVTCVGSDVYSTGNHAPTTSSNIKDINISAADDTILTYTPVRNATNITGPGSKMVFTCSVAGEWHIDIILLGMNITSSAANGTFVFSQ